MSFISRGFRGRREVDAPPERVPPGQYVTGDFPVLSAGPTPNVRLDDWRFEITGEVDAPRSWTWQELMALPAEDVTVDIHCVTKWSKLDTAWKGVSVDTLLKDIPTAAEFVMAHSYGGYTTNLPARGPDRRQGVDRLRLRRRTARAGAWRAGAAARAAPVLLEEREVGSRHSSCGTRTSPASGRATATTTTATHGANSDTRATDLAGRRTSSAGSTRRPSVRSLVLDVPDWPGHLPGQHVDVRLTAEDGYQTERSYSIATPADGQPGHDHRRADRRRRGLALPRRRAAESATSSSCAARSAAISCGAPSDGGPLLLAGGGSGIVPLMAMLRARVAAGSDVPVRLLVSARSADEVIYRDELESIARDEPGVEISPDPDPGPAVRLDGLRSTSRPRHAGRDRLAGVDSNRAATPADRPASSRRWPRVSSTSGTGRRNIRTERFGPTGG